ncbi:RNA-guided endonuclease InsQ/TnpB family protein [Ligilactobacillus salivarius]|uniref:RNA-guided endonuclease InsQ/TnpB family protein n=1 Tax=Ligilactobacillus salivarius TaxID=1624 RepID=UPI00235E96B3|nr:RNA-guided endonuclease TnpB family protein [Ligilactobacillus salivarius]MDD1403736.1 RNA-guided endonuclease TnpB family protein [Ligilactobacillus salivarius]
MKKMSDLEYRYGLKMRIYPSTNQKKIIKINGNIARTVYNKMVAIDQELYKLKQVKLPIDSIKERIKELESRKNARNLSNHYQYMQDKNIDSLAKANAIQNYQKAWKMFRKVHSSGTPKFHKKSYRLSYQTNAQYGKDAKMDVYSASVKFLDKNHISLPKLGRLRVSGSHRRIIDNKDDIRIGTVTISKDTADRYFVSMQLGSDTPFVKKLAKTNSQVGVDLNTENFLTDSFGKVVANPRYYRTIKGKIAKAQKILSRRQRRAKKEKRSLRDSKNYQKQRVLVAKLHDRVRNQRNNFLNHVTTALINNHDLVVVENLRSKNMLKNHALAMSISDVGWRSFLQKLDYKANLYNRTVISVNPKNTTQTCYACGFIMGTNGTDKLNLKDREWTCPNCHEHHIRDWNAAKNILAKGLDKLEKLKNLAKAK